MPGASIYIASKHAVEGITKTTALELAGQGIRVNAVAPGAIATDMIDRFAGAEGTDNRQVAGISASDGQVGASKRNCCRCSVSGIGCSILHNRDLVASGRRISGEIDCQIRVVFGVAVL
jgi:NAD(P)-dependent dehydrogenase (short-subunit alcohol dehydrogenase family)